MGRGFFGGSHGTRGGFRGGRGIGNRSFDQGPPEAIELVGEVSHACQRDLVCRLLNEAVPFFNASIYLENKQEIGKVDEIFGPIKKSMFSIKLADNLNAESFKEGQKMYINKLKLLTLERIMNANAPKGAIRKTPSDARGRRVSGNFNGDRGGRGRGSRGGARGGRRGGGGGGGGFGQRQSFRGFRGFKGPRRGQ
ncbi:H/ACA ribonucleoprotein complex subunit [Echinococcus granulosus]|uniref:H/ACA ribonucleoprotein complex subunit n=1 Tax=Echinococcus granulosus TaxID=6210 RepID=U6J2C4_ECHGR|nr:H/ACA ribonucleoprotein complex subunit [Echinococcus granulosus]EUB58932.1 H/ACA ribonucleoprotein complex subunit [Echinococcus granulosus]CDS18235.1 H:ACA ribonucleoprotein complex subunit [Echinococcus granulosus]